MRVKTPGSTFKIDLIAAKLSKSTLRLVLKCKAWPQCVYQLFSFYVFQRFWSKNSTFDICFSINDPTFLNPLALYLPVSYFLSWDKIISKVVYEVKVS